MQKNEITKDSKIKLISMHDEMSSSYLSYAMSVIVSRALPDIRDGFSVPGLMPFSCPPPIKNGLISTPFFI